MDCGGLATICTVGTGRRRPAHGTKYWAEDWSVVTELRQAMATSWIATLAEPDLRVGNRSADIASALAGGQWIGLSD